MKVRLFIEKKDSVNIENNYLLQQFKEFLHIKNIEKIRVLTLYDIYFKKNINQFKAKKIIISALTEKMTENIYFDSLPLDLNNTYIIPVSLLPGQFDQKADSAATCIMLVSSIDNIIVKTAKIYSIFGDLTEEETQTVKNYLINPVDSCLFDLNYDYNTDIFANNISNNLNFQDYKEYFLLDKKEIESLKKELNLAMSIEDLNFISEQIKKENRGINSVELKILDTYWSDHCRHTTFNTELRVLDYDFEKENTTVSSELKVNPIKESFKKFIEIKNKIRPENSTVNSLTLMELATINAKYLKSIGKLEDVEESEEINACSVIIKDENEKEWLIEFKNETHNHPTEIEPYGGASTCIGGAIRDPLSSRAYVFGAMRVSGGADPNQPIEKTMKGKLPQRKITTHAAKGFSSYGNQIGLATGQVIEFYHENYVAKRLEAGSVIGAVPKENVIRKTPKEKDIVILIGGRTGRDGIGGATGSSKNHDENSVNIASSEVQKGNPVIERKLQRFFSKPEVTKLILKCNDFGAGGVAVAVGELADGLNIYLDKIPLKYTGLKPMEIILSESQERMACVIEKKDLDKFIKLAVEEDLEANFIAEVVKESYVTFYYKNIVIAKISRNLLDSKGAKRDSITKLDQNYTEEAIKYLDHYKNMEIKHLISNLNVSLQLGLNQMFDNTIGGNTIYLPYGGKYQLASSEGMAFTLPDIYKNEEVDKYNENKTKNEFNKFVTNSILNEKKDYYQKTKAILMAIGFDPYLLSSNTYIGGYYSIIEAITKIISMGGDLSKIWLSLQEFFGRTSSVEKWNKVLTALLGAFQAQLDLGVAAIGGKDSMSGTFNDIDVPPTLITFAVSYEDEDKLIPSCFMGKNNYVYLLYTPLDENLLLDIKTLINNFKFFRFLIEKKLVSSSRTIKSYSLKEAIIKSCFGNKIGFSFDNRDDIEEVIKKASYGSIMFESELDNQKLCEVYYQFLIQKNQKPNDCLGEIDLIKNIKKENDIVNEDIQIYLIGKTNDNETILFKEKGIINSYTIDELVKFAKKPLENIFPSEIQLNLNYDLNDFYKIIPKEETRFSGKKIVLRKKPSVLILVFSGTNCEFDTRRAFKRAGFETEIYVIKTLNKELLTLSMNECSKKISENEIICIPGGFSMGDEPDGSGKFIVSFLKSDKIRHSIEKHLEKRKLILGICNGFQALIKSGLLPYGRIMDLNEDDPSLVQNIIGKHVSRFVNCKVLPNQSPWHLLTDYHKIYSIPISHGEGRFFCSKKVAENLFLSGQVTSIYVDNEGRPALNFPDNPNGSIYSIESIISPDGLVLGKMGHTERVVQGRIKNFQDACAEPIFESAFNYFS